MRPEKSGDRQFTSLREHDVYQEVAEDERWTVPSDKIIPGNSVFTIKREGTKKVRVDGGGHFQEYNGLAVFTVNVNVITVRVVMLIAGMLGRFLTRIYVKTAFSTHLWTVRRKFT